MQIVPTWIEMLGWEIRMIRRCEPKDFEPICDIINDGAHGYEGIIPKDRWRALHVEERTAT
jgi:hypothetical protein